MAFDLSIVFPCRLVTMRQRRDLTQGDLAKKAQINSNAISQYETGARLPTAIALRKLAVALNVSADYLLGIDRHVDVLHPPKCVRGVYERVRGTEIE